MAHGKDQGRVDVLVVVVKRDVSRFAARDHQVAQPLFGRPADQGMAPQHVQRIENDLDRVDRRIRVLGGEEFEQTIQVGSRPLRQDYPRHFFARSLRAGLPAARAE